MANICDYDIHVVGSKKACLMVYESMPICDAEKDLYISRGIGNKTEYGFTGDCKWSVNFGVTDEAPKIDLDRMNEREIHDKADEFWEVSLKTKSKIFQCEIMVHYWSAESGFNQFDYYSNGKVLKQRKIEYNYEEEDEFDWDKLEFVGHEGEYDESVDGEQQDADFMARLIMGLGGALSSNGPQMNEEGLETLNDFANELRGLLGEMEGMAADVGLDLDASTIGETGFDMYNWTFTEGKTVRGDGWTIAIPDGFVRIDSREIEPITGKKRLFELVPATCIDEGDVNKIPVRILPGWTQEGAGLGIDWMVHPEARAGKAGIIGVTTAQMSAKMTGQTPKVLSVGWADAMAHIMVFDTTNGSYSFQSSVLTENKCHPLRIQTQYIRKNQKRLLETSVQAWLKTMHFDKPNKLCPTKTIFEENACYEELLKENTAKFEEAVEQARMEYNVSVNGKLCICWNRRRMMIR